MLMKQQIKPLKILDQMSQYKKKPMGYYIYTRKSIKKLKQVKSINNLN